MTIISKFNCQVALFCAGLAIIPACNTNSNKQEDSKEQATQINDQKFENKDEKEADRVVEAYTGNLYEIRCAENAANRALTKDVQKLAGQIVAAHTKMNTDIEALAAKKNITLPTVLSDDHQKKLSDLVEKKGIDYDKEFLSIMKDKHEDSEKMYQRLSENSEDTEIKAWAASVLPEIRSHLDMVKNTKDVVDKVKDPKKDRNTINNDWDGDKSKLHDGRPNVPNEVGK